MTSFLNILHPCCCNPYTLLSFSFYIYGLMYCYFGNTFSSHNFVFPWHNLLASYFTLSYRLSCLNFLTHLVFIDVLVHVAMIEYETETRLQTPDTRHQTPHLYINNKQLAFTLLKQGIL